MRLEMSRNISSLSRAACGRAARAHLLSPHTRTGFPSPGALRPSLPLLPCTGASLRLRCSAREPVCGVCEFGWHVRCECECAVAVASCWLLLFRECLFVLLSCRLEQTCQNQFRSERPTRSSAALSSHSNGVCRSGRGYDSIDMDNLAGRNRWHARINADIGLDL